MSEAVIPTRKVTIRPATILPFSQMPIYGTIKKRVAAYARVSTDDKEQLTSYETQVSHYTSYIQSKYEWEFVNVYADEGLSGLMMKNRKDFNRMVQDALDGKIDLILVKSISRFARNTVDTLNTVRALKEKGCEVFFEKENLYSFDPKAELLLTIMASLSQEESRSISENVSWGMRAKFAEGRFSLPYGRFLGYEKGEDGKPKIIEEEAKTIRMIYALFLAGKTPTLIAKHLTESKIPTPGGKTEWSASTIQSILTNEKYRGDAVLQKTFTVDFLRGKAKVNEGELPQYHFTETHEAIIEPEIFEYVQHEMERRRALGRSYSGKDDFASRIVCGDCGLLYGGKVWYSNTKYRRTIWRCNGKYEKGKPRCGTPHLTEDEIKAAFLSVINRLLPNRERIIAACRDAVSAVMDSGELEYRQAELQRQLKELVILIRTHIKENTHVAKDQDEYARKHDDLVARFEAFSEQRKQVEQALLDRQRRRSEIEVYLGTLDQCGEVVTEFNGYLWNLTVDTMAVQADGRLVFIFKDGREIIWY